jgi:hypothetical protein
MPETQPELSPLPSWRADLWLRRLWPLYCLIVIAATYGYARFDPYLIDGDAVAYMDIGDMIRAHNWAGVVNGYWHPLYPAALALGHTLFHSTRYNELNAYYMVNFGIFLLEMLGVAAFTDALVRLRDARLCGSPAFLLSRYPMRYIGMGLLVIATQRELSIGRVRPDALLQALILLAFASLLTYLANDKVRYSALAGVLFGLAFLAKSFAFPVTLLSIAVIVAFSWLWKRRPPVKIIIAAVVALACFAVIAGPYISALSKQKGRLNFGESGSLNYAWYVGGTEKMHLQNGTPQLYGTSDVHLKHPEHLLLQAPVVADYSSLPYGTYPPWFDATYFNDTIKTHMNVRGQIKAITRDIVLTVRYLFNHPEGWVLFLMLMLIGARPDLCRKLTGNGFWVLPLTMGIAMFVIYGLVNIEERYVTLAWLLVILTLFAALRTIRHQEVVANTAAALLLLFAFFSIGESVRRVFDLRRNQSAQQIAHGWYAPEIFKAAEALNAMGIGHGEQITCAGTWACLYDHYWARLADVRITSEIYLPQPHPFASLADTKNLQAAIAAARSTGSQVIVGYFDPVVMQHDDAVTAGWVSLGDTDYYALRLNPSTETPQPAPGALP